MANKHFMKAILPSPIHSKQVRIPDQFISWFGNELNTLVTLTLPDGRQWDIQLSKCHTNGVFLCNKWQDFSQHYSLHYGYYLDFNYQGNSNFTVVIYDTTCLEISYPLTNTASNEYNPNNPSFYSKSIKGRYAYISADFATKYLKLNVPIKLQNSQGKQWQVSCGTHMVNSSAMRISAGFTKFAKENNLSEGVTYVFELIKKEPVLVLLVTQLHKTGRGRHVQSAKEKKVRELKHFKKAILPSPIHAKEIRIPNEFVTRFGKELGNVAEITVPDGSVWEMKLEKRNENIFLSTRWQEFAKYYSIEYGCYLSFKYEGDSKFSVVIFDATSVEICYPLKTSCTNEEQNIKCPCARKMSEVETNDNHVKSMSKHASERVDVAANEFNPENPFFRSKVYKGRYPYAPSHFAKKYLKSDVPIKLQNADGKQWEVCCAFNLPKLPGAMRIVKGYFVFHTDNNLSEGDHCVFELIKETPVVLKVTIFRVVDYAD
ncbi:unnamed protein product [Lathyrus sativus]|nr:unnamed protein product [Lathyrus sativus]